MVKASNKAEFGGICFQKVSLLSWIKKKDTKNQEELV